MKFSGTPVEYRHPPPLLGEHTEEVLRDVLGMSAEEIRSLVHPAEPSTPKPGRPQNSHRTGTDINRSE